MNGILCAGPWEGLWVVQIIALPAKI